MKTDEETELASGGFRRWGRIVLCGLGFLLVVVLGYYSGSRRADSEIAERQEEAAKRKSDLSGPGNFSALDSAPVQATIKGPEEKAREPFPLENLPSAHLKKFREAEEFVSRIPEMEKRLMEKHPLLGRALELEKELREEFRTAGSRKAISEQVDPVEKFRLAIERNALKLDSYLDLLDDPVYAPFIEDGLRNGYLAEDVTGIFAMQWSRFAGVDLSDVDVPEWNIESVEEFRKEFGRFANEIKSRSGNQNLTQSVSGKVTEVEFKYAMLASKFFIIAHFKQSLLPTEWVDEYWKHYQSLASIRNFHSVEHAPTEIVKAFEELKSHPIAKPQSVIQEF